MKIFSQINSIKKFLFIIFILNFYSLSYAEEIYYKFGVFDYSHQTDMYAFGRKKVTNNQVNISFLGEVTQIYDLIIMADKEESFQADRETKNREEYAGYFSSGFQKKLDLSKNLELLPSFSVGLYEKQDDGKAMGHPIQFKSELELNYFTDDLIFGVTLHHISNANISSTNPGSDTLLFGIRKNY